MRGQYQIVIESIEPGADEFTRRFREFRLAETTVFFFEDKTTACEALKLAAKVGLEPQFYFVYELAGGGGEETAGHCGFYFVPSSLDNIWQDHRLCVEALGDFELVEDFSSEHIFVNERVRQIFGEHSSGVEFVAVGEDNESAWYRIAEFSRLPEPVQIPHPVFVSPNLTPPGTYAVQSDGRDVLTSENILWLEKHGAALSDAAALPTGTVKWRDRIIASGKLIAALERAAIRGLERPLAALVDSTEPDCD